MIPELNFTMVMPFKSYRAWKLGCTFKRLFNNSRPFKVREKAVIQWFLLKFKSSAQSSHIHAYIFQGLPWDLQQSGSTCQVSVYSWLLCTLSLTSKYRFLNTQFGAALTSGPGKLFPLKLKAMHYAEVVGMTNNFLPGSSEMSIQY